MRLLTLAVLGIALIVMQIGCESEEEMRRKSHAKWKAQAQRELNAVFAADMKARYLDAEHRQLEEPATQRRGYNFRNARWGDSKARVMYTEYARLHWEAPLGNVLVYESLVGSVPVRISYYFTDGKLSSATYFRRQD